MSRPKAFILPTATRIAPFGDAVSEAYFTDETIRESQLRALRYAGFEPVATASVAEAIAAAQTESQPMLFLLDRVFLTEKAARDFVKQARKKKRLPAALALPINASVEYTLPLQDVLVDHHRVVHDVILTDAAHLPAHDADAVAWIRRFREDALFVDVLMREVVIEAPLPVIGERKGAVLRYPLTSTLVVSIEHWTHILWLNQIAFGVRWIELMRRRPLWAAWRAATAFSLDAERILMRLVSKGKNVRVHPTATLMGSIIGDNVTIGPHVTVKNSIVGAGTTLLDHSALVNSVVGQNNLITENTFMVSTVTYPDATVGNYKLQVSLIGRGAYVNAWAGFVDAKFVGHVAVAHRGGLASTERQFLGSVVGHRARVAAKVLIHPGREIPNDALIVMRPDEVVSTIPADLVPDRPMVRDGGTLVPLGAERKGNP